MNPGHLRTSSPAVHVMRTLVVSVGNTSLFGGVYAGERLVQSFRIPHTDMRSLPRRIGETIDAAALCSVVPALAARVLALIRRTWEIEPQVLTADSRHGLVIDYRRPRELGTDRIAAALGARARFPRRNRIVVDCGTATTVTALRHDDVLLGGAIFPGLTLSAGLLAKGTAQLPRVAPRRPGAAVGRSPREGIASGVFFGQVGAIRETVARVQREAFGRSPAVVIGTGGHAPLLATEELFDAIEPHLLLIGLRWFATATATAGRSGL